METVRDRTDELQQMLEDCQAQIRQLKDTLNDVIWEIHKIKLGIEDEKD